MSDLFTPEEIEKTRQLLELFDSNSLSELSISEPDGYSIEIGATPQAPPAVVHQFAAPTIAAHIAPVSATASAPEQKAVKPVQRVQGNTLNSPMVGIFYTSPSPGDPAFISVGDVVKVGQTIGLIEAMKVFSEIPAEAAGKIVEILVPTGTLVQQSQPLYSVEPS